MKLDRTQVAAGLVVAGCVVAFAWPSADGRNHDRAQQPAVPAAEDTKEAKEPKVPSPEAKRHTAARCLAEIATGEEADRRRAVAILRNLGEEALTALREEFADEDGGKRREAAAYALAVLGGTEDRARVAEAFLDTRSVPSPLLAAAAAELKDPSLVAAFLHLRDSPDRRIREAVALALRSDRFPHIKELIPLLADAEPRVRAVAERTLTAILSKLPAKQVERTVAEALTSKSARIRATAVQLCAKVDERWALDLATKVMNDPAASVRDEAMRTLARKGDRQACKPLVKLLAKGINRREKVQAANALSSVDAGSSTREALAKAAAGKDPLVALAAGRALVVHGDLRGIAALLSLRSVRESEDLDVDDEDVSLLKELSGQVLHSVQGKSKRRAGEDWTRWWLRVKGTYRFPRRTLVPTFPENH